MVVVRYACRQRTGRRVFDATGRDVACDGEPVACNRQAHAGAPSAVPGLVADRSKKWFPASKPSAHLLGSRRNTAAWWPAGSASRHALTCTRVSQKHHCATVVSWNFSSVCWILPLIGEVRQLHNDDNNFHYLGRRRCRVYLSLQGHQRV